MKTKIIFFTFALLAFANFLKASDRLKLPLKQDADSIKSILLEHTPVGTTYTEVFNFIKNVLHHKNREVTYDKNNGALSPGGQFVGTRSVSIYLGEYGRSIKNLFLVSTKVYAEWGFNNNDRFLDIVIIKEGDGP